MLSPQPSPSKPAESSFEYDKEKRRIDQLIGQWHEEIEATNFRRDARKKEVNVSELQTQGKIPADGTFIARRIIDRNIRFEKPELAAYLEQSPRLVLFKSLSDPTRDTIPLADWFTLGMRYKGWAEPWHRLIDATCLHGAAPMEVRYDASKPFNLALEYTPREFLIYPRKVRKSLQKCEMILRVYEYLPNELEDAVKAYDFDEAVVKKLIQNCKETSREIPIKVYKVFRKKEGIIYVAWYSPDADGAHWLKNPEPLSMGIIDPNTGKSNPVSMFPFFLYLYEFTEEEEPLHVKGRAARDLSDQDAMTHLWTSLVNGTTRAADLFGSYKNDPVNPEGQESRPIKGGTIQGKEVEYFQPAYPDPMILQVAQALSTENMQAAGKVDYAAQNREDSRKTATEINSAKDQSQRLSSINIIPLATVLTDVYTFCWNLVQQQVQISMTLPPGAGLVDIPQHIDPVSWTDNYELAPAGDVEVIKRAEKISNLQQDLPLFANTPIYMDLVSKYLELRFPDEAMAWKAKLQSADLAAVVQQLLAVMSNVPVEVFPPEQQQQIQEIMQNATAAITVQAGPQPMANGPGNQGSAQPPANPSQSSLSPSTSPIKGTANG